MHTQHLRVDLEDNFFTSILGCSHNMNLHPHTVTSIGKALLTYAAVNTLINKVV